MGRFSAAKMFGAIDKKFQDMYNSLIDLLDTGYSVSTTLGGKKVKIDINAKEGISITVDGVKAFGVTSTGRVFTQSISDAQDSGYYGEIGDITGYGKGLSLYSPTYNFFRVLELGNGGFALADVNGVLRVLVSQINGTQLLDKNGVVRVQMLDSGSFGIYNASGNITLLTTETDSVIRNPGATHHSFGVNETGPYYYKNGVRTYL